MSLLFVSALLEMFACWRVLLMYVFMSMYVQHSLESLNMELYSIPNTVLMEENLDEYGEEKLLVAISFI